MKNARLEVIDILDKMQFFQGQRAGRELWNEKPFNIQEQDIDNFNRHIRTIRDYIWDLERKLKAYEDAEEQGLLLRLPCKVGDTVYCWRKIIPTTYSNYVCEKWLQTDDEFIPARVVSIRTTKKGMFIKVALKGKCLVQHRWDGEDITSDDYEYCMVSLQVGCIGKTVFLTKEEAEQKLAEMKGEV